MMVSDPGDNGDGCVCTAAAPVAAEAAATVTLVMDPPPATWRIQPRPDADRDVLARLAAKWSTLPGAGKLTATAPLLATGHQAALWHPGILAKDIAAVQVARRLQAGVCHVVVDQDVNDALRLELPVNRGGELASHSVLLGRQQPNVPTGFQPPIDPLDAVAALRAAQRELGAALAADLDPLIAAWHNAPGDLPSLALQVTAVLLRLVQPALGNLPIVMVSDLAHTATFQALTQRMLHDARAFAAAYNQAVAAAPEAGITPLAIERERIELPLWAVAFGQPRQPVFADLADSEPILTLTDGSPVEGSTWQLAPRALILTAVMRSGLCDLFIHGKGGGVYDRVTDRWWSQWSPQPLSPFAVVSADLRLPLHSPLCDRGQLHRAVWWAHHLPHNLDRALQLDGQLAQRKRNLLAHMDDDRDPQRRRDAFAELHRINQTLAQRHPDALRQAAEQLSQTQRGVRNRGVALKRDWSCALYPPEQLQSLVQAFAQRLIT